MAEDNKELEKLNKSVNSIMKHLGAQGSPAQAKKEADQKSKTAQQDADNAQKDKDLLDDKEKGEKESRKLFAGTMRMGAHIWQNLSTHIFSKMNEIFGAVVGHVKEVLGPIVAVYDAAKATLSSAFDFVKGTILSFGEKPSKAEKKTHGFLKTISDFAKKSIAQMKGEFAAGLGDKDKKKSGWMTMALIVIGAIIGGIVSAILKPFVLLGKAVKAITGLFMKIPKVSKAVGKVGKFFKSIGDTFAKVFGRVGKFFGSITAAFAKLPGVGKIGSALKKVGGFFKKVGKILMWIIGKIPGIKPLLLGLKLGFKFLGWPIAILFAIIDFIRGFIKEFGTSGSIIESIKEGLRTAIMGFIELPIKLIGWMIDKVLGWFGVEGADSANKILDFINKAFDFIFGIVEWYWTTLIGIFKMVFGGIWDLMKPFIEKVWPEIKGYVTFIFDGLKWIWSKLWGIVKIVLKRFGFDMGGEEGDTPTPDQPSKTKRLTQAERDEAFRKGQEEIDRRIAKDKADKAAADAAAKAAKETGKAVVMGMAGAGGGAGVEIPQIPDEVDNWGITSKNYDMEMF